MPAAEFTEYAIKYSREARESRKCIRVEHLPILGEIEAALADNPDQYPERVIPASRDGKSVVYMHPSPRIQITYEVDKQNKVIFVFNYTEQSAPKT
jgi:mRNA-degrading endonuclease RelE of RelBE toxin-antitoxin system